MRVNGWRRMAVFLCLAGAWLWAAPARGQEGRRDGGRQEASPKTPAAAPSADADMPNLENILKQAAKNIAVHYNLNDDQAIETEKILVTRVKDFLRKHHDQVWPILRQLITAQATGGLEDPEQLMRIGKSALPLFDEVKRAIRDGNEEWRLILTEDQKVRHDADLRDMEEVFVYMDRNFQSWSKGDTHNKDLFPPANPITTPRPKKPAPGIPKQPKIDILGLDLFDRFVEAFIKDYELDPAQAESARSILKEYKAKGEDFRTRNREGLEKLSQEREAAAERRDREALKKVDEQIKEAQKPINELLEEMKLRLEALLTSVQREKYDQKRAQEGALKSEKPRKNEGEKEKAGE